jgi:hypothetical protein
MSGMLAYLSLENTRPTNLTLLTGFTNFRAVVHSDISLGQFQGTLQAKCRYSPTDKCEVFDHQPMQVEYVHFLQRHHFYAKINSQSTVVKRRNAKDKLRDALRQAQLCCTNMDYSVTNPLLGGCTLDSASAPHRVSWCWWTLACFTGTALLRKREADANRMPTITTQEWSVCGLWKARSSKLAGSNQDCETITCKYVLRLWTSYLGYHNLKHPNSAMQHALARHTVLTVHRNGKLRNGKMFCAKSQSPERQNEEMYLGKTNMEWTS